MHQIHLQDQRILIRAQGGQPRLVRILQDGELGGDEVARDAVGDGQHDGRAVRRAGDVVLAVRQRVGERGERVVANAVDLGGREGGEGGRGGEEGGERDHFFGFG